jgi:cysteinyl-tRNA synthetase
MCSDVLGGAVDINCGGVDLTFPHHENQLAQSEAFWGTRQWVNFFLHTGARAQRAHARASLHSR